MCGETSQAWCGRPIPPSGAALRGKAGTRQSRAALLYAVTLVPFPGSSVVEQPAVNRLVAGSNPARGAKRVFRRRSQTIPYDRKLGKSP